MQPQTFEYLRDLLKRTSGLMVTTEKTYLLQSRLLPIARRRGMQNLDQMVASLKMKPDKGLTDEIIEAMTTNETYFFRDDKAFKQLRENILPALLKAREGSRKIRIWSAASSTGQEAYSMAMIFDELLAARPGWAYEIVGTDISPAAVERARRGEYSAFEVQRGLPIKLLMKYFSQTGQNWTIKDEMKRNISFRVFNLHDSFMPLGRFDLIVCRNVLIYFDDNDKRKVLTGMKGVLAADGYLFLGSSETILGLSTEFTIVPSFPGFYSTVPLEETYNRLGFALPAARPLTPMKVVSTEGFSRG
ncbi:MAG: protein-glutamate O-methyltransferase CheR [Micavibrio aeruginosavorus]|uniref:protein-glutamate O-methyltransferase n=1 Tax=Micavibrio aeruginosavorus TaxID=349221 RepID=A0A7T5R4V1_9BACT|nr:MAG: protein-glutamate O-methyltransferase CheR [Micavibrio aeruginosavorus]